MTAFFAFYEAHPFLVLLLPIALGFGVHLARSSWAHSRPMMPLAAVAQCRLLQAILANQNRADRGEALAYGEDWVPPELALLEAELGERGL